jgi:Transposase IS116/IS110/IS902 family
MTSVPGVGTVNAAQILARLGDPARFRSLAGARSFSGLVPALAASGTSGRHGPPTKAGDASLREALFLAADHARRADPTLAARYYGLMVHEGKHHNSALCHIAPTLLTRIIACWRAGTPARSATPTAPRSPPPRAAPSSPDATASPTSCAPAAGPATPRQVRPPEPNPSARVVEPTRPVRLTDADKRFMWR